MKKVQKKLVLKKKTIAQLNDQAISKKKLQKVNGGAITPVNFSVDVCLL
mgnify:CR=1 FL=1